jgi:hypothetical protein
MNFFFHNRDLSSIDIRTDTLIANFNKQVQQDEYMLILNQHLYSQFTHFVDHTETDAFKK